MFLGFVASELPAIGFQFVVLLAPHTSNLISHKR
jgi:hypothetical protein